MAISVAVLTMVFGTLGNIISFFVCLAPVPTFVRIYKRKSSEGYQSIPYVIALFSAMLWIYYAMIKKHVMIIFFLTYFLFHGKKRVQVLGYICMVFSLCVFIAPLGIIRKVIKTKSVEFMPFGLSFFLTLSALMWFIYGRLLQDYNIALPNVLGFTFGVLQMILYWIYKKRGKEVLEPPGINLQEVSVHVVD